MFAGVEAVVLVVTLPVRYGLAASDEGRCDKSLAIPFAYLSRMHACACMQVCVCVWVGAEYESRFSRVFLCDNNACVMVNACPRT